MTGEIQKAGVKAILRTTSPVANGRRLRRTRRRFYRLRTVIRGYADRMEEIISIALAIYL